MNDDQKKKLQQEEPEMAEEQLGKEVADSQSDPQIADLQKQVQNARTSELRAMADYQNLVRRTQEDRIKMVKFAALSLIESLLQPLDHLALAKEQLKDKGLDMVHQQFVQALQNEGVEEIAVVGKEFDPETMEVVNKEEVTDAKQDKKVIKVVQRGYRLNGEVIRHAKVTVGEVKK
jgi:molecular chaperone GrpE